MSSPDKDVDCIENISQSNPGNNFNNLALESDFRGFEKFPKVLLQRVNITPFLNDGNNHVSSGENKSSMYDLSLHRERLSWKCSVNLLREDLLKTKESFEKNSFSHLSKSVRTDNISVMMGDKPLLKDFSETVYKPVLKSHSPPPKTIIKSTQPRPLQGLENIISDTTLLKSPVNFKQSGLTSKILLETSNMKCEICNKNYSSQKKLQTHQEAKHMFVIKLNNKTPKRVSFSDHVIVHEVTEHHKCRKCSETFENYRLLKVHMKKTHKKRRCYVCDYCHKYFMDRMFFKQHIKLHCDICKLLLPNKSSYLEHRRVVCRVVKRYKCKTCNESFFKFMDLKEHSYEHISTYFICDICKDQFSTKCEVAHHILFLHSENRPLALYDTQAVGFEILYKCNFCKESSLKRESIEKHVAGLPDLTNRAMTGYLDFYFCDQCLKKFDTEKDMLQHKWTHFLKNSDNSQVRQKDFSEDNLSKTYNVNEKLPISLQPKVVLEKLNIDKKELCRQANVNESPDKNVIRDSETVVSVSCEPLIFNIFPKQAVVDPKSKKTIISKHQCQMCGKFYSTNYCLNRHKITMHSNKDLQCKICEETFVWPSLLRSHNCLRMHIPEMPFDDARPEIHFENLHDIYTNGFDTLDMEDDYMNNIDFEIPAPIVELTEYEGTVPILDYVNSSGINDRNGVSLQNLGFKIVMQEVPIEF